MGKKMKKGEAKIEFFSNLKYLQNEYNNGLVISKFLHQKAKNEKNFRMTYAQFNKYFNDVFGVKKNQNEKLVIDTPIEKKINVENTGPIKASIDTKEKKVFSALYGKQIQDDDIL